MNFYDFVKGVYVLPCARLTETGEQEDYAMFKHIEYGSLRAKTVEALYALCRSVPTFDDFIKKTFMWVDEDRYQFEYLDKNITTTTMGANRSMVSEGRFTVIDRGLEKLYEAVVKYELGKGDDHGTA